MKIVLYGACSFPFFFREMIKEASKRGLPFEWRPIVRTWRHLSLYEGLIPPEHLFYVPPLINRLIDEPVDLAILSEYPGSIIRDIIADRNFPGQLRQRPKAYQLQNMICHYRVYKDYLLREKPDYVFFPVIETHEGMALYAVARELGIPTIFRTHARNLSLSFFSTTPNEDAPTYVFSEPMEAPLVKKAREFIADFQKHPHPAIEFPYTPRPGELIPFRKLQPIRHRLGRLPIALWNLYKDARLEPHTVRPNPLWQQGAAQLWWLWEHVWRIQGTTRKRFYDIHTVDQLPKRFIYYPLHLYPEISITTMAPYYEDQWRAIDLLRFNMPSDHLLVVKEHPSMRGRRPVSYYKEFRRRAGVILADHDMPSIELIKRASLTVGITGTASFEALLLQKPSLAFGKTFFSPWIPHLDSFDNMDETIQKAMSVTGEDMYAKAVDCVYRILKGGYDFVFRDPHDPELDSKHMMNYRNLDNFLLAFQDHLRRLSAVGAIPTGTK